MPFFIIIIISGDTTTRTYESTYFALSLPRGEEVYAEGLEPFRRGCLFDSDLDDEPQVP